MTNGRKDQIIKLIFVLILVYLFIYTILSIWLIVFPFQNFSVSILNLFSLTLELLSVLSVLMIYYHSIKSYSYDYDKYDFFSNGEIIDDELIDDDQCESIALIIPIYKENDNLVINTLKHILDLDYPKDKLDIYLAHDGELNNNLIDYSSKNNINYVNRKVRLNFKAGAINNIIKNINNTYFFVIDADHILREKSLKVAMSIAKKEDDPILIQMRADFHNLETWLQKASCYLHSQFFGVYQKSRSFRKNALFAGTTALLNREKVLKYGGILTKTIAEDTDSSVYWIINGEKTVYVDWIASTGLVPWDPISQIRQIWRWNNGLTKSLRTNFKQIIKTEKISIVAKLDILSTLFLSSLGSLLWSLNFIYVFMYFNEINYIRASIGNEILIAIILSASIFVLALSSFVSDKKLNSNFNRLKIYDKFFVVNFLGFLTLASQPFLIDGIIKAWLNKNTIFKRTPKTKEMSKKKNSIKIKYLTASICIFIFGIGFGILSLQSFLIRSFYFSWFIVAFIASLIPLMIAIPNYRNLEKYLEEKEKVFSSINVD
ncbi:MAG: glycosyltransferase [Asgard group archaeon]|nr:glycosyltransferase [Asgard group archaeon]